MALDKAEFARKDASSKVLWICFFQLKSGICIISAVCLSTHPSTNRLFFSLAQFLCYSNIQKRSNGCLEEQDIKMEPDVAFPRRHQEHMWNTKGTNTSGT